MLWLTLIDGVLLQMQKLHLIADIGSSFVKSLNYNGISSSHAPALILLPSSFYRVSYVEKNESARC